MLEKLPPGDPNKQAKASQEPAGISKLLHSYEDPVNAKVTL